MSILALRIVGFVALLATGQSQTLVTPVEKVVTLLTDLKAEVTKDGETEATAYDKFACWCKTTTKEKSDSIVSGQGSIEVLSTEIADKTSTKVLKEGELAAAKAEHEKTIQELAEETATYEKTKAEYEIKSADLDKALSSLTNAIKAMKAQKDAITASLLEVDVRQSLVQSLALADALNLISAPKQQKLGAFLQQQVDPSDPNYKYHSSDIIQVLEDLKVQFTDEKSDVDKEWNKFKGAYDLMKASLEAKIGNKADEITRLQGEIKTKISEIATARGSLVIAQSTMQDDKLYLKDMTHQCEVTANDWDQQSKMRADEITVLDEAIGILSSRVAPADVVNVRALLQANNSAIKVLGSSTAQSAPHTAKTSKLGTQVTKENAPPAASKVQVKRSQSFLQLHRTSAKERRDKAVDVLQKAGQELSSPVLSALATQIAADPFAKVKGLIEKLIQRLVAESTAEATKKGYCDTELAKAKKDRDYRWQAVQRLSVEAGALEVKRDELTEEIAELKNDKIPAMKMALNGSATLRASDKATNMANLQTARDGLKAITEAISILTTFYRKAGRATVLLQRVSPIEEDMPAITAGAYKGKQVQKVAIISLLEQIQDDFERTIKTTTAAEQQAHADYVEVQRTGKSSLKGYETKLELNEEDLEKTSLDLAETMDDLSTNRDLVDSALKQLEALKPTCIDSGMSYADRVAKREEEIAALKKAMCILDTDGVEAGCP